MHLEVPAVEIGLFAGEQALDYVHELAQVLASKGIVTREDLAEQAIDDLLDIDGIDSDRAGALIMAARKHWFDSTGQQA